MKTSVVYFNNKSDFHQGWKHDPSQGTLWWTNNLSFGKGEEDISTPGFYEDYSKIGNIFEIYDIISLHMWLWDLFNKFSSIRFEVFAFEI